jgi:hypothetical protein
VRTSFYSLTIGMILFLAGNSHADVTLQPTDDTQFQAAVDATAPGETLFLKAGHYPFKNAVRIQKSIHIMAANPKKPPRISAETNAFEVFPETPSIIEFRRLVINASGTGIQLSQRSSPCQESEDPMPPTSLMTVSGCEIHSKLTGIRVVANADDFVLTNNIIHAPSAVALEGGCATSVAFAKTPERLLIAGNHLYGSVGLLILPNVLIKDNDFFISNIGVGGFLAYHVFIEGNRFIFRGAASPDSAVFPTGVHAQDFLDLRVTRNSFDLPNQTGVAEGQAIVAFGVYPAFFEENIMTGSRGITALSPKSVISKNIIGSERKPVVEGIVAEGGPTITENVIYASLDGIKVENPSPIYSTEISGNKVTIDYPFSETASAATGISTAGDFSSAISGNRVRSAKKGFIEGVGIRSLTKEISNITDNTITGFTEGIIRDGRAAILDNTIRLKPQYTGKTGITARSTFRPEFCRVAHNWITGPYETGIIGVTTLIEENKIRGEFKIGILASDKSEVNHNTLILTRSTSAEGISLDATSTAHGNIFLGKLAKTKNYGIAGEVKKLFFELSDFRRASMHDRENRDRKSFQSLCENGGPLSGFDQELIEELRRNFASGENKQKK